MLLQTLEHPRIDKREQEFYALELERLKTDQVTEASERLNGAMENVFEYELRNDDFYFQDQALKPIFIRGIKNTEEIVKHQPQFGVELLRRHIELQQLMEQIEIRRNVDWSNPLVLVHISPIPDAVLHDDIDLNAYDKQRKKVMIRITEPTIDGVKVTSMSLDGNDRVALQAVGDFFGVNIADDASSEDILAKHFLAEKSQFNGERPAKIIRERYDEAMRLQYGGEWYAGRRESKVLDTKQQIERYPSIIEQHVDEIWQLKKRLGSNFRFSQEYQDLTYNFLAAIEQSDKRGRAIGSISAAGEVARSAGVEYAKSDCPTGLVETAEQALEAQGINALLEWHHGTCRVCLQSGMVGACEVCRSCEDADNRGISLELIHAQALRRVASDKKEITREDDEHKASRAKEVALGISKQVKRLFGERAIIKSRIEVGDEVTEIVDSRTGEVIVASVYKEDLVLAA